MLELLSIISLSVILFIMGVLWSLWILYVAMMNINRVKDNLPWQAKLMVYPTVLVFDLVEVVANSVVCSLVFLDWPRELTVSDRLRRYAVSPEKYTWRLHLVNFIKPMLDPFDP